MPKLSRVEMKSSGSLVIAAQDGLCQYLLVDELWGVDEDKSEGVVVATAVISGF